MLSAVNFFFGGGRVPCSPSIVSHPPPPTVGCLAPLEIPKSLLGVTATLCFHSPSGKASGRCMLDWSPGPSERAAAAEAPASSLLWHLWEKSSV